MAAGWLKCLALLGYQLASAQTVPADSQIMSGSTNATQSTNSSIPPAFAPFVGQTSSGSPPMQTEISCYLGVNFDEQGYTVMEGSEHLCNTADSVFPLDHGVIVDPEPMRCEGAIECAPGHTGNPDVTCKTIPSFLDRIISNVSASSGPFGAGWSSGSSVFKYYPYQLSGCSPLQVSSRSRHRDRRHASDFGNREDQGIDAASILADCDFTRQNLLLDGSLYTLSNAAATNVMISSMQSIYSRTLAALNLSDTSLSSPSSIVQAIDVPDGWFDIFLLGVGESVSTSGTEFGGWPSLGSGSKIFKVPDSRSCQVLAHGLNSQCMSLTPVNEDSGKQLDPAIALPLPQFPRFGTVNRVVCDCAAYSDSKINRPGHAANWCYLMLDVDRDNILGDRDSSVTNNPYYVPPAASAERIPTASRHVRLALHTTEMRNADTIANESRLEKYGGCTDSVHLSALRLGQCLANGGQYDASQEENRATSTVSCGKGKGKKNKNGCTYGHCHNNAQCRGMDPKKGKKKGKAGIADGIRQRSVAGVFFGGVATACGFAVLSIGVLKLAKQEAARKRQQDDRDRKIRSEYSVLRDVKPLPQYLHKNDNHFVRDLVPCVEGRELERTALL